MTDKKLHPDADAHKGAVESQSPNDIPPRADHHSVLADQLPHRHGDEFDGADSDFPEPGSSPEHSGQRS
ncbi:hypothetical protein [Silvibacterium sp.]|uniref:hypothetical protein n=1 Tax=Silvibacterium sp. TaxID=1964179 RepID=UPI0039E2BC85